MKRIEQTPPERHRGNGQPKIDGAFWTRASTLAGSLDDKSGLMNWKAKMAAKGIVSSEALRALASTTDIDDYRWKELVERACEAAGAFSSADTGTAIHAATELLDFEEDTDPVPLDILRDAQAYKQLCESYGLKPLAAELFVANKQLKAAGSFDRLVVDESGEAFILDIKTTKAGKDPKDAAKWSGVAWSIQTATYAHGVPYDGERGWLRWTDLDLPVPSIERAFIVALGRGSGECSMIQVDLEHGYRLAQLATEVREARKSTPASVVEDQTQLIGETDD